MSARALTVGAMYAFTVGYFVMIPTHFDGGWLCLCASSWLSGYLTGGGLPKQPI